MTHRVVSLTVVVFACLGLWRAAGWEAAQAGGRLSERGLSVDRGGVFDLPMALTHHGEHPSVYVPRSESLYQGHSAAAIRQVFGGNVRAYRVAKCESKLNARAVSNTGDFGLYQLHRTVWDPALNPRAKPYWPRGKDWSDVFDPVVNARVAWAISKRGTDFWTHWKWSAGCWA